MVQQHNKNEWPTYFTPPPCHFSGGLKTKVSPYENNMVITKLIELGKYILFSNVQQQNGKEGVINKIGHYLLCLVLGLFLMAIQQQQTSEHRN